MLSLYVKFSLIAAIAALLAACGPTQRDINRAEMLAQNERGRLMVQQMQAKLTAKWEAFCQTAPSIRLGMSGPQVRLSKWENPSDINTTETAQGTREQWVYEIGPICNEDGTPRRSGTRSYLYFGNDRLITIQRNY